MIQLMEDVWFATSLDTHWTDPNNVGWINLFQRWAYTPSFRLWWPILKPMYGRKFRRFMEERLSLADEDYPKTLATVRKHDDSRELPKGVAQLYWKRMHETADRWETAGKAIYLYELRLTQQREEGDDLPKPIQAGLAFIDLSANKARWNVEHLFVPPSLWGAGLGERFLNELLAELKKAGCKSCEVTIETPVKKGDDKDLDWSKTTDPASQQQLNDLLAFYQRAQFNFDQKSKTLVRIL
jgi:GNAT superfamily N-acetyltransferase